MGSALARALLKAGHDVTVWNRTLQKMEPLAIDSYSDGIGAADGRILVACSETAFVRCKAFLKCLGGDLRYLGENIGAAAALDLAELSVSLGNYVSFAHGARLCEAEGVGADLFASLLTSAIGHAPAEFSF